MSRSLQCVLVHPRRTGKPWHQCFSQVSATRLWTPQKRLLIRLFLAATYFVCLMVHNFTPGERSRLVWILMLCYSIFTPFTMLMELYSSPRAKFLWEHSYRIISNTFRMRSFFDSDHWSYEFPILFILSGIAAGLNAGFTSALNSSLSPVDRRLTAHSTHIIYIPRKTEMHRMSASFRPSRTRSLLSGPPTIPNPPLQLPPATTNARRGSATIAAQRRQREWVRVRGRRFPADRVGATTRGGRCSSALAGAAPREMWTHLVSREKERDLD